MDEVVHFEELRAVQSQVHLHDRAQVEALQKMGIGDRNRGRVRRAPLQDLRLRVVRHAHFDSRLRMEEMGKGGGGLLGQFLAYHDIHQFLGHDRHGDVDARVLNVHERHCAPQEVEGTQQRACGTRSLRGTGITRLNEISQL